MAKFTHLNIDWNADPNDPNPKVVVVGTLLTLEFAVNPWAYSGFNEGERAQLEFSGCKRYRLGPTNDEGWSRGQCRFSKEAPRWGEFYEVSGDLKLVECPNDWDEVNLGPGTQHFLFYLRDETFECDADSYIFTRKKV